VSCIVTDDILIFMFAMLFGPTEFHDAGPPAYKRTAMSYRPVFQLSVPVAFIVQNGIKVGGNLLGTQAKREIFDSVLFSKISYYLYKE